MINTKINYRFILIFLAVLVVFNFLPLFLLAANPSQGLVPCGAGGSATPSDCRWADLVTLFEKIVNFLLFSVAIPLAVIAIVYSGIQILLAQDKPGQLSKAYGTLQKVGIGMFMSLGAYAIVKTIVSLLARKDSTFQNAITSFFGS